MAYLRTHSNSNNHNGTQMKAIITGYSIEFEEVKMRGVALPQTKKAISNYRYPIKKNSFK